MVESDYDSESSRRARILIENANIANAEQKMTLQEAPFSNSSLTMENQSGIVFPQEYRQVHSGGIFIPSPTSLGVSSLAGFLQDRDYWKKPAESQRNALVNNPDSIISAALSTKSVGVIGDSRWSLQAEHNQMPVIVTKFDQGKSQLVKQRVGEFWHAYGTEKELFAACVNSDHNGIMKLLQNKFQPFAIDHQWSHPLHVYLASLGSVYQANVIIKTVDMLLGLHNRNSILNRMNKTGSTPLSIMILTDIWTHVKIRHRNIPVVNDTFIDVSHLTSQFIAEGANLKTRDESLNNIWHKLAAIFFSNVSIDGFPAHKRSSKNKTEFKVEYVGLIVQTLREHGLSINDVNNFKETGLDVFKKRWVNRTIELSSDDFQKVTFDLSDIGCLTFEELTY